MARTGTPHDGRSEPARGRAQSARPGPGPLVCVIEIPKGSRNKYEHDAQLGGIKFDRLLMTAATYPADYGYLRDTLALDGDPLDALVCLYEPTFPGCLIPVKPIGMFKMRDEKGPDEKIICIPLGDPYWSFYEQVEDLPLLLRQEIEQFFSVYKDLEPGKSVTVEGWASRADAESEIASSRERWLGSPAGGAPVRRPGAYACSARANSSEGRRRSAAAIFRMFVRLGLRSPRSMPLR